MLRQQVSYHTTPMLQSCASATYPQITAVFEKIRRHNPARAGRNPNGAPGYELSALSKKKPKSEINNQQISNLRSFVAIHHSAGSALQYRADERYTQVHPS